MNDANVSVTVPAELGDSRGRRHPLNAVRWRPRLLAADGELRVVHHRTPDRSCHLARVGSVERRRIEPGHVVVVATPAE